MQKIFFTPGPSQLFPTVPHHIQTALEENIGSISHRSQQFGEIFSSTQEHLKELMNIPSDYHIFFLSSGTEAMERIIENCVEKESMHFVNGSFSKRFYQTAVELKKQPKKIEVESGGGFDFISISKSTELLCFTHNETSTGVMQPLEDIYKIKKQYPDKLFSLDIVSSAPYATVDFTFFDCVFLSVQKGFGLPAGLGVLIVSPGAIEKTTYLHEKGLNIGTYHNFLSLLRYGEKQQTTETPPVLHIYLFNKVLQDMLTIGIENIRKQTDEKAKLVYDFLDSSKQFSAFIKEKKFRSPTVITVQTGHQTKAIKESLAKKGIIVGGGYGKYKEEQIRIANFPAITLENMKMVIKQLKDI